MSELYSPEQVLPHRGPMLMLKEIIECGEDSIACSFIHNAHDIFTDDLGRRPSWVGLEYMCQSIAALEGVIRLRENKSIKPSFVIGAKRVQSLQSFFYPDEGLTVTVKTEVRDDYMFGAYLTEVFRRDKCIMRAIIKGVMIENPDEIWER